MYKVTVAYEDFEGMTKNKPLYFNIFTHEAISFINQLRQYFKNVDIDVDTMKGTTEIPDEVLKTAKDKINNDPSRFVELISLLVDSSYGVKSEDGESFIKNPQQTEAFKDSMAYEALFLRFLQVDHELENFIIGIMPKQYQSRMAEVMADNRAKVTSIASRAN